jgi:hypothetical protein
MKHAERMCSIHKAHATLWTKALGKETHSIRYWGARITRRGIRDNDDPLLDYYLLRSNVNKVRLNTTLTVMSCIHQLTHTRIQLKDVLKDAKSNGSFYEVEVSTTRVEKRFPHLTEDSASRLITQK